LTTPEHYAFIKIAEGCDNRCSYCIIPYLRGKFRSRQMDDVLYEARLLAANGVKELIVVAQDTSRYGTDLPGHQRLLPELLRELCKIDGFKWIRVHYVYPDEIDDAFIEVMATEPKIVKYLDIPIQHCNSKILKLMNRRGDGVFLRELFAKLRERIPGLVLRTSVITGLPGEGEEEFAELCQFLKEQKLERVGAFPFSPEEGTPAAEMEFPDSEIAQERAQMIETIQSRIMDDYNESMMGKTIEVLVDGFDEEFQQFFGRTYGDSPEIDGRVWIASEESLVEGTFVSVCIDGIVDGDLSGYLVEE
jgi:ribosomal protein S12 methylthiotransferase